MNYRAVAVQQYRKGRLIRYSICPDHNQKTSNFQGIGDAGWHFRCKENAKHTTHIFVAKPPTGVPNSPTEIEAWIAREKQAEKAEEELKKVKR